MKTLLLSLPKINVVKRSLTTYTSKSIHVLLPKDSPITRVRIWKSGYYTSSPLQPSAFVASNVVKSFLSPFKGGMPNIGHVSIETREIYASLWPTGMDFYNKYKPQPGTVNNTHPIEDERTERRPPDYLIDLYIRSR